jgi:hypothetical protein
VSTRPTDGAISASRRQLARGLAISVAVAALILATIVLPAEYGIDPLGTGRALGLTALRGGKDAAAPAAASTTATTPTPAAPATAAGSTLAGRQEAAYRTDARTIELAPGKGIEIKTRLEKGAALVYSWRTRDGAKVLQDFHGEPLGAKPDVFESFIKDEAASESRGYLIAPFTGTHGWYWKNRTSSPVTIELQVSGFYIDIFNP